MPEAIFGLVGVVIGGLLNGGVTYLLERGSKKNRIKISARMVVVEIRQNIDAARVAVDQNCMVGLKHLAFRDAWLEHRETLASVMNRQDWRDLAVYYRVVDHHLALAGMDSTRRLEDREMESLEELQDGGEELEIKLKQLCGDA